MNTTERRRYLLAGPTCGQMRFCISAKGRGAPFFQAIHRRARSPRRKDPAQRLELRVFVRDEFSRGPARGARFTAPG